MVEDQETDSGHWWWGWHTPKPIHTFWNTHYSDWSLIGWELREGEILLKSVHLHPDASTTPTSSWAPNTIIEWYKVKTFVVGAAPKVTWEKAIPAEGKGKAQLGAEKGFLHHGKSPHPGKGPGPGREPVGAPRAPWVQRTGTPRKPGKPVLLVPPKTRRHLAPKRATPSTALGLRTVAKAILRQQRQQQQQQQSQQPKYVATGSSSSSSNPQQQQQQHQQQEVSGVGEQGMAAKVLPQLLRQPKSLPPPELLPRPSDFLKALKRQRDAAKGAE